MKILPVPTRDRTRTPAENAAEWRRVQEHNKLAREQDIAERKTKYGTHRVRLTPEERHAKTWAIVRKQAERADRKAAKRKK